MATIHHNPNIPKAAMTIRRSLACVATISLTVPVLALAGVFYNNPPGHEDQPRLAMARAWLVRVRPGPNAPLYENAVIPGCPALTKACRPTAYLVPGDIAVAAYTTGIFTVVDFVGRTSKISDGAIESRLLEKIPTPRPAPRDWIGHWQSSDEADIVISRTRSPAVLAFVGNATWGAHDPERVKRGGVHIGAFAAYVKPVSGWGGFVSELDGEYDDAAHFPPITAQPRLDTDWTRVFPEKTEQIGDCQASFRLLGPYLLTFTPVDACGGFNISFTGVYRRVAPHKT